jgi:3D (Asp-Asp-Asp) domain-containing protein
MSQQPQGQGPTTVVMVIVFILVMVLCFLSESKAEDKVYFVKSETIRYVTAYNVGDPAQTDSTPCIGAANTNLCEAIDRGERICAANFVPLGTPLHIDNVGVCIVTDRMNRRYRNRVDLAMPKDKKDEARIFGCQKLQVRILKEIK